MSKWKYRKTCFWIRSSLEVFWDESDQRRRYAAAVEQGGGRVQLVIGRDQQVELDARINLKKQKQNNSKFLKLEKKQSMNIENQGLLQRTYFEITVLFPIRKSKDKTHGKTGNNLVAKL